MTEYSGLVMKPEYLFYREASLLHSTIFFASNTGQLFCCLRRRKLMVLWLKISGILGYVAEKAYLCG